MYAYMMAKYLKGKKDVRVMALGTGRDQKGMEEEMREKVELHKTWTKFSTDFTKMLTDFEQTTATYMIKTLNQEENQIVRV
jgi:hypothetical protein